MQTYDMEESIPFTVRYTAEGASIAEDYRSALGAIGRVGALVSHGIGSDFAIWSGPCVLMDQAAIFESLRLTAANSAEPTWPRPILPSLQ